LDTSKDIVTKNLIVSLLYFLGAIISYAISIGNLYYLPIWLPLGLAIGYAFLNGRKVLFGFIISSLVAHFFLGIVVLKFRGVDILISLLLFFAEGVLFYFFTYFWEKFSWQNILGRSSRDVNRFYLFIFIGSVPLAAAFAFPLVKFQDQSFVASFLSVFLSLATSILVYVPAVLSYNLLAEEKFFKSHKERFVFFFLIVLIVFIGIEILWHPILTSNQSDTLYYFVCFSILFYISVRYTYKVYSFTLAVFVPLFLFSVWINQGSNTTQPFPLVFVDPLLFVFLLSLVSQQVKEKISYQEKSITAKASDYSAIEEEVARQVAEYKSLNNRLFEEIEKRALAEKELEQSRKLLFEAQQVAKISIWEYSFQTKQFSWLSKYDSSFYSDINSGNIELSALANIIHPDDFKQGSVLFEQLRKKEGEFETEIRIKGTAETFGFFLLRGKSLAEKGSVSRILGLMVDVTEQKKIELEIREKEQKYQALFELNIDPVCVIEADNLSIVDVNPAFLQTYGYQYDELIGKPYTLVSAQPDETKTVVAFAKQKGYYRVTQRLHRNKSGEEFYVEGSLMSHEVDGKIMLFIISHDITRRREAEKNLAEREQKFRAFFESDLIGMAEVSITKEWISFNDKLCSILGYSQKELHNYTWDQLTHPDDLATEIRLYNQLLTHESDIYSIEKRFITKKSTTVTCKVTVKSVKTLTGNISHLIKLVEDISERKRAEKELIESRAKLSHAQSVAKLGTIRFIPESNLIHLSDEAYEILGFGKKKPTLTRRDFFKTILPDSQTRFEEHVCNLEAGANVEGSHEQTIITPKGDIRYTLTNFGKIVDENDKVVEVVATLADITRIKQAEMSLLETNALKDQILSIIGHDLRSPIGSMKQLIDIYADGWKEYDVESADSIIKTLQETSGETYKLLENLLEWANSQQKSNFKPERTDLVLLAEQVIKLSKSVADGKGITLQKNLPDKAMAFVDVEMIKTIIRNLISNSIKFTPASGVIMVTINDKDDNHIVSISDTGAGISEENIPKLFDTSISFTTPGTENEKGTGLGLKLVKKFVEKNGGEIKVESILGQGTVFSFSVPKYIDHE